MGLGPNPIAQVQRSSNTFSAVSGRIGALAIRPSTHQFILGAAQGGIWLYDAATGTWSPRTDNQTSLAIGALAIAPSNDAIVYAGTGEGALSGDSMYGDGILKSTDGGLNWTHVSGDYFQGVAVSRLLVDPANPNHLYAAILRGRGGARRTTPADHSRYGIWESKDGAVSWKLLKEAKSEQNGATDIEIDPQTPSILYASFWSDAMYKSTDAGKHWSPIMTGLPTNADYAASSTRFSISVSRPSAASRAVLYVGLRLHRHGQPGRPPRGSDLEVDQRRRELVACRSWFRDQLRPGLLRYAVLLRQRRRSRPDQPERPLRSRLVRLQPQPAVRRSLPLDGRRYDLGQPRLRPAPTSTRWPSEARANLPARADRLRRRGLVQPDRGGRTTGTASPLASSDWQDERRRSRPQAGSRTARTSRSRSSRRSPPSHRVPPGADSERFLGRHAGQRHAPQVGPALTGRGSDASSGRRERTLLDPTTDAGVRALAHEPAMSTGRTSGSRRSPSPTAGARSTSSSHPHRAQPHGPTRTSTHRG